MNPERGRKRRAYLTNFKTPFISEREPRKGTETSSDTIHEAWDGFKFQNVNPERGRKQQEFNCEQCRYNIFQNVNPERGRKPKLHGFLPSKGRRISEREPRKGTETRGRNHASEYYHTVFQNVNPERGRKQIRSIISSSDSLPEFQNVNPERGRKQN